MDSLRFTALYAIGFVALMVLCSLSACSPTIPQTPTTPDPQNVLQNVSRETIDVCDSMSMSVRQRYGTQSVRIDGIDYVCF